MRKLSIISLLLALLMTQSSFADEDKMSPANAKEGNEMKPCAMIAKACAKAGFERKGADGKSFWKDCMQPLLMGKTVAGVELDKKQVKACRDVKISKMEKELQELKQVQ